MAGIQPNEYKLRGERINVTYLTDGFHDVPTLSYSDGQQNLDFSGTEIRTLQTEIGTLVTVTTRRTIDTGATLFSFLLPGIELADRTQNQSFRTAGVITLQKGPDSIPLSPFQTYEVIHMHGTASSVMVPLTATPQGAGTAAAQ